MLKPVMLIALLLTGCSGRANVAAPADSATQTASQPNTQGSVGPGGLTIPNFSFQLSANLTFTIALAGHGTEGYDWSITPDFNAAVVAPVGVERFGPLPANSAVGVSAPSLFDFKGVGSGQTSLHFTLARPGVAPPTGASAPTDSATFNVSVQ